MARKKAAPPSVVDTPASLTTHAIKGFNKDWTCRGYQYAVGETFRSTAERPVICSTGFHACEMPLDVLGYYPISTSVYASVDMIGEVDRKEKGDSKIASVEIAIKAEIRLPEIIRAAGAWIVAKAAGNMATGDRGHAAATGDRGHAAATGDSGHAAATGDRGHAAATGYSGHAAATGHRGHAAATGDSGHAAATGDRGHAAATGYSGHAAATGDRGHAAATGDRGHAAATGDRGHAAATGHRGHAAATGHSGIAAALGGDSTAMTGFDGWLVLSCWEWIGEKYTPVLVKAAKVGGPEGVKPNVAYTLKSDGSFVEVSS